MEMRVLRNEIENVVGIPSRDDDRRNHGPDVADASKMQTVRVVHGQESKGNRWVRLAQPSAVKNHQPRDNDTGTADDGLLRVYLNEHWTHKNGGP